MKTLLYASPFPPKKSGISDYSVDLVYGLKKHFDITLLIDDYVLSDSALYQDFKVLVYGKDELKINDYDYLVYNIGNQPFYHAYIYELCLKHPGLVILHDSILYYLGVGYHQYKGDFFASLYEMEGIEGIQLIKERMKEQLKNPLEYKDLPKRLPMNKELFATKNRFMVHSQYAESLIRYSSPNAVVKKVPMVLHDTNEDALIDRDMLFNKYGIPQDAIIISSFGYIASTKQNDFVCQEVLNLPKDINACYVMVGEGSFADKYVDDKKVFKTGYVSLSEMQAFIKYSDIVVNLRYPSMGETSGALIRIMAEGKPCFIVKDAWFAELPDDTVIGLDVDSFKTDFGVKLKELLLNPTFGKQIGENAKKYMYDYHGREKVSSEIRDFLMS